jgi:hypothetical protein
MNAAQYNFVADQGATFSKLLECMDTSLTPIDLSGYTASMQVRDAYGASDIAIDLSDANNGITLGGAAGTIALWVDAEDMAALSIPNLSAVPGRPPYKIYVYDLELSNGAVVTRLLQGTFTVYREVSK